MLEPVSLPWGSHGQQCWSLSVYREAHTGSNVHSWSACVW